MDYTDIFRLIGWALVFMFPLVVIYLTGGPDKEPLLDDVDYERRKRKRAADAANAAKKSEEKKPLLEETTPKKNKKNNKKKQQTEVVAEVIEQPVSKNQQKKKAEKKAEKKTAKKLGKSEYKPEKTEETEKTEKTENKKEEQVHEEATQSEEKIKEIDEHMDPTANYARVMRIKPEEVEDEWEAVPEEEGWSQVKSRKPHTTAPKSSYIIDNNAAITEEQTIRHIPGLDKKQRENLARQAKKKQQKAAADALQAERLRKHQKELEKIKIQEFYSSGKGKNTPWGSKGSSKTPKSTASINEYGQLIWD